VQFVEAHNFHVGRHCWFGVQMGEKCKSTSRSTVPSTENSANLICFLCKIRWSKPPRAFGNLVEGGVVDKFGIQTFVQFRRHAVTFHVGLVIVPPGAHARAGLRPPV
jgi:hypothetical protein